MESLSSNGYAHGDGGDGNEAFPDSDNDDMDNYMLTIPLPEQHPVSDMTTLPLPEKHPDDDNEMATLPLSRSNTKRKRRIIYSESSSDEEEHHPTRTDDDAANGHLSCETSFSGSDGSSASSNEDTRSPSSVSSDRSGDARLSTHPRNGIKRLTAAVDFAPRDHFKFLSTPEKQRKKKKPNASGKKRKPRTGKSKPRNPSGDRDGGDDESFAETEPGNSYGESQEVSIHRIQLGKFPRNLGEEDVIGKIIQKYNEGEGHPYHSSASRINKDKFEEKGIEIDLPAIRDDDKQFLFGEPFSIKIYVQTVKRSSGLLNAFGIHLDSAIVHAIIFYYREGDLFALTTGQAWNCVQWCSDYDFPAQIAARLLSEEGQLDTTSKAIIGNEVSSKRTMKAHQGKNRSDIVELCTSFSAKLRPCSSLQRFYAFKDSPDVKVTVGLASVRFKKRLDVRDFPCLLSQCSVIAKGQSTYSYNSLAPIPGQNGVSPGPSTATATPTPDEEMDTDAHLNNLTRVSRDMSKNLDLQLAELIYDAMQDKTKLRKLENFTICHKHFDDFFNASKIALSYKGKFIKEYMQIPTLAEILDVLGFENLKAAVDGRMDRRDLANRGSFMTEFLAELDKVNIAYCVAGSRQNDAKKGEKLFNFLEGSFWNEDDGRMYWHVLSQWCSVRDGYLLIVHEQFLKILKAGMIGAGQDGSLAEPWPRDGLDDDDNEKQLIANYTRLYANIDDFYPMERKDENYLCDLIYINDKKQVFLYFITRRLDYESLSARAKITQSALSIQNALRGEKTSKGEALRDAVKRLFLKEKGINSRFKNVEEFRAAVIKAKIVYAFGDEDQKLEKESQLSTKISSETIEDSLEMGGEDGRMAGGVYDVLVESKYVDPSGTITSKLLISSPMNFDLGVDIFGTNVNTNQIVFDHVIKNSQSNYNGILLKLEFQRIKRDLDGKDLKFLICPIPCHS